PCEPRLGGVALLDEPTAPHQIGPSVHDPVGEVDLKFIEPAFDLGEIRARGGGAALLKAGAERRTEPLALGAVEDRLCHELLDRFGERPDLPAAGEAGALGAHVAAPLVAPRSGDQRRIAQAASDQAAGEEVLAGGVGEATAGVQQEHPELLPGVAVDDRRPGRRADDLGPAAIRGAGGGDLLAVSVAGLVLAQPSDPRADEHAPE